MTDDLNKQWAGLEGWKLSKDMKPGEFVNGPVPNLILWVDKYFYGYNELPNWTKPNRFFAEVVPRMKELGLYPHMYWTKASGGWLFSWYEFSLASIATEVHGDIGIAGLTAAIQARKELGNG